MAGEKPRLGFARVVGATLCVLVGLALLSGAPAFAEVTYPLDGQLVPSGGSFGILEASSVAVNDFNGNTYVADSGSGAVDVFDSSRVQLSSLDSSTTPAGSFGGRAVAVAANNGTGEVYVLDSTDNVVDAFDSTGKYVCQITGSLTPSLSECNGVAGSATPAGALNAPGGITVDQATGDVYVIDGHNSAVDVFSVSGAYSRQISLASVPGGFSATYTRGIAIDDFNGHVYVSDSETVRLYEFDDTGNYLATWTGLNTPAGSFGGGYISVAANNATGTIYVTESAHNVTDEFDSSGKYLAQFSNNYQNPRGTVVDQVNGKIYVSDNSVGNNPSVVDIEHREVTVGPRIDSTSSTNVASTSATLDANINPNNAPTSYYFQYGTSTSYGSEVPLSPGLTIGSAEGDVAVGQHLQNLLLGTTYHYRVVAVSELIPGKAELLEGPDRTFTTQAAGAGSVLPDGREWELVSPPDKHGATIEPISEAGLIQASVGGGAFSYFANAPTESDPQGDAVFVQLLSTRGRDGWASKDIATPNDMATGALGGVEYKFFSEDLTLGVVEPFGSSFTALSGDASELTPYLRTNYTGGSAGEVCSASCYRPLVSGCPPVGQVCPHSVEEHADVPAGTVFGGGGKVFGKGEGAGPTFVGGTPDLSHVVVQENSVGLTAGTNGGLYEWTAGKLAFIGTHGASFDAISDDGSRVVFTGASEGHGGLLVRDMALGKTVQLDAVQGGSGQGAAEPVFQYATGDGSKVFFTDHQSLTADADGGVDLYECDVVVEAGKLACRLSNLHVSVLGRLLGTSKDGSWIYFASNAVLASGGVNGGCGDNSPLEFTTALCNVYVLHAGVTKWVATVSWEDSPDWSGFLPRHVARVSPNGEWLTFMSQESLTGYDNRDAVSGHRDEEVYLYHAGSALPVCVSCNPTGARPMGVEYSISGEGLVGGDRVWNERRWLAANVPGWTPYVPGLAFHQSRFLSDNGRLFFNSSDALVPRDVNGDQDVYEFSPPGTGSCNNGSVTFSERVNGCLGLISSGGASGESAFLDASETGSDVFFLTSGKLSGLDYDTSIDVYDAHECSSGSPCLPVPANVPPVCSTGDACKAAPSPQPLIFGAPASATFSGTGNVIPGTAGTSVGRKRLTRSQLLKGALRGCHAKKRKRRAVCERQARAKYRIARSSRMGSSVRVSTEKGRV